MANFVTPGSALDGATARYAPTLAGAVSNATTQEASESARAHPLGAAVEPGETHGSSTVGFDAAVAGAGLRALADTSVGRALVARLELTGFQQRVKLLNRLEGPGGRPMALWFQKDLPGLSARMTEGVVLEGEPEQAARSALEVAENSNATIALVAAASTESLPEDSLRETVKIELCRRWQVARVRTRLDEVMRLAAGYEQTLAALGRHTRRNMRHARKLAAAEGMEFAFTKGRGGISDQARVALGKETEPYPISDGKMRALESYADCAGASFHSVVSSATGDIISYSCGYIDNAVAYLVYQLNSKTWSRIGPSLLHRAYLVEALIEAGCEEIVYVHGCSGVLRHGCVPMTVDNYLLVRNTPAVRFGAKLIAKLRPDTRMGKAIIAAAGVSSPESAPELGSEPTCRTRRSR